MKFLGLVTYLSLFFYLDIYCKQVVNVKHGDFRYNEHAYISIERLQQRQVGRDTFFVEKQKLSDKVFSEVVFENIDLPRVIEKFHYPVDRIITYHGTKSNTIDNDKSRSHIHRTETKEWQIVHLFFYRGVLIDYSIYNGYFPDPDSNEIKLGKNSTNDVRKKFVENQQSLNLGWPTVYCDKKFYYFKHSKSREFIEKYLSGEEDCDWENPDFEERLKAEGYYKRKQTLDSGDFSALVRKIQ